MPSKKKIKSPRKEKTIKWIPSKKKEKKKEKKRGDSKRKCLSKNIDDSAEDLFVNAEVTKTAREPVIDPKDLLQELTQAMKDGNTDPLIREMAKYAVGDVVGLGLMSQAQYDEDEEFDESGEVIKQSGRQRALGMIPTMIRAKVLCDITPYFLAKKSTTSANGAGPKPKVTIFVPDNNRRIRDDL